MRTIKVYKTNVDDRSKAKLILDRIRRNLPNSDPSFDLEDCDRILRIERSSSEINESDIRVILSNYGYHMEKLS